MTVNLSANLVAATEGNTPHSEWSFQTRYITFPGILPLVYAAPDSTPETVKVVKIHAAYAHKIVTWQATRLGAIPTIPPFETTDPNEVLLSAEIAPAVPGLTPTGDSRIHTVSGQYIYLLKKPPTPDTGYPMGTGPYESAPAQENVVRRANFSKKIYS